jgi:hypothetical protein
MANITGKGGFKENPQNINREGKPKGTKSIPDMLRRIGDEEWIDKDTGKVIGEKLDVVMQRVYIEAVNGASWATNFIADRTEGKALDRIEATINQEPIKVFEIE